ncbi:MAG: hypothetical protein IKS41_05200 [Alphaproteobacteria bacterium]|nr:hypothetical protein [Alphaproteobacteria bacterium]
MKKIFFTICLAIWLAACGGRELPLPDTQNGVFRGNLTYAAAEEVLFDACTRASWQVINKGNNFITINLTHKGYSFDADIQYTNSHYAIIFRRLNQDRGSKKEAYAVYKKYAIKLNKVIQKTVYNKR